MKFGLLGRTLGHSYSPAIHHALGNESYTLFEKEPDRLADFFGDPSLQGLNVTIPYKIAAYEACQTLSDRAQKTGVVNTMVRRDGVWHGDNTDYLGFLYSLDYGHIEVAGKVCLILGDGASSHTLHIALEDLGAKEIIHLSRKTAPFYQDVHHFYHKAQIIINATPVGMYPKCPQALIDLAPFSLLEGVVDLIYNPLRTSLLLQARQLGLKAVNGLPFLVAQAVAASELFLESESLIKTEELIKSLQGDQENIILVGMPGVGKTTVGKALAQRTGRTFIDIDQEISKEIGAISNYIQTQGEAAFRQVESKAIQDIGKRGGLVIATGGGAVTIEDNFLPLRQNGRIYQLTQPLDKLATAGRPLSAGGLNRLKELEAVRTPMYQAFSQCTIAHHRQAQKTVDAILQDFKDHLGEV